MSGLSSSLHGGLQVRVSRVWVPLWATCVPALPPRTWNLHPRYADGPPRKAGAPQWPSVALKGPSSGLGWARKGLAGCLPRELTVWRESLTANKAFNEPIT